MTFVEFVIFAGVGKLLIYLLQKFPFQKLPLAGKFWVGGGFLAQLFGCDLCLGVWVYTILALLFRLQIVPFPYIPLISELVVGGTASFIMHTLSVGWRTEHTNIIIMPRSED